MPLDIPLSPAARKRIERLKNRRGRVNPAKVPVRLTRTSAFAPKSRGLITDSSFKRVYHVPGHSIVQVTGRELGTQHRDALYAVLRLAPKTVTVPDRKSPIGRSQHMEVHTTWRELLAMQGLTPHANNVAGLVVTFEELMQVVMTVFDAPKGGEARVLEKLHEGALPDGTPVKMRHILESVEAEDGVRLDAAVKISYGRWMIDSIQSARLVSLNADVHFALGSDYAKAFWPYIDSFNGHTWVDEEVLAALAGWGDLFDPKYTAEHRRDFRRFCRRAFDDMVKVGGLKEWSEEERGVGRMKTRRYHYALGYDQPAQMTLNI